MLLFLASRTVRRERRTRSMRNCLLLSGGLLVAAVLTTGCGHRGKALPSAMGAGAAQRRVSMFSGTPVHGLIFDINVNGTSPDGAYQIRSLHDAQVHIHQAFSYGTTNGTYTQIEYSTPFGLLTVTQSPKHPAPPALTQSGATIAVSLMQSGTTAHGGKWFLFKDPSNAQTYDLHVEFAHSVVDTALPSAVPADRVRTAVEELY